MGNKQSASKKNIDKHEINTSSSKMLESSNDYKSDITIYGATGFVARYVCEYLISALFLHSPSSSSFSSFHITLAGRNTKKLNDCLAQQTAFLEKELSKKQSLTTISNNNQIKLSIYTADCHDLTALLDMTKRTRIVINCAGPFEQYGTCLVEACAKNGIDYVDITGEVDWAGQMRRKYGKFSAKSKCRIISLCGFDSIPSDLSVFESVRILKDSNNDRMNNSTKTNTEEKETSTSKELHIYSAKTWYKSYGFMNGGTFHTMLQMPIKLKNILFDEGRLRPIPFLINDPFVLVHPQTSDSLSNTQIPEWKFAATKAEWLNLLPAIHSLPNFAIRTDDATKYCTSIPFFMAAVNAKVVMASAVALNYSSLFWSKTSKNSVLFPFTYQERMLVHTSLSKIIGYLSLVPVVILYAMVSILATLFFLLLKLPFLGNRLAHWILPPGSGPSININEKGYAEIYALVKGERIPPCGDDDTPPNNDSPPSSSSSSTTDNNCYDNRSSCRIRFQGDPGNLITSQCVSESALCLLLNRPDLPPRSKDGFGTPAQLLGSVLLQRLENSPVRPVLVERHLWDSKEDEKKEKVQ